MDIDEQMEIERVDAQKRIIKGFLRARPNMTPEEMLDNMRCLGGGFGTKNLSEIRLWMKEMTKDRKFVLKPKGEKGYGYYVLVDGVDIGDYVSKLEISLEARDKVAQIEITMIFAPGELGVDVPAEIKLKIEELKGRPPEPKPKSRTHIVGLHET